MPSDADIAFRPVGPADMPMLAAWLERPHWQEGGGEPKVELGYIRDMIEGRDTTRPYIFSVDGEDAGYIQVWYVREYQVPSWADDYPWLTTLPANAVGVDLSIADAGRLAKGLGPRVLGAFVGMLREQGHETIIIDPDPGNRRAVRAYEKSGFRVIADLVGRTGDCLLMQHMPGVNEHHP